MIVDGHCHAGKGDGLTGPWSTEAPLGTYLRRARQAGIERTLILPAAHSDYHVANAGLARIAARHPGRFICFAAVHPQRDKGRVRRMVGQAVARWRFQGIKVHRHDAPATREVCETALAFGIPVLYDVMGETSLIEMVAPQFPRVNFVVPHLGSFADDWRAHVQLIDQLVRFPNVYADTSGVRRFDYLVEAIRRAGAGKLIFGSDGPWLHPALEVAKVRLLGLSGPDQRLVLGGNLLRLLASEKRPPPPRRVPRVTAASLTSPPRGDSEAEAYVR